jgi:hypothetical protein
VKLEAENCPGVFRISRLDVAHAELYKRRETTCQHEKEGRAFPRQLKQTVPCAHGWTINVFPALKDGDFLSRSLTFQADTKNNEK